jgi:hypothetical protein
MTAPQTTEDAGTIVRLLGKSEIVKAAIAETAAANTLARRGIIAQVKALERAHTAAVPKLEATVAAAMAALKLAQTALQAAEKRANAAIGEKSTASHTYSAARDRLEQRLRESAHPAIKGWQREMRDEIENTRKRFAFIESRETVNIFSGAARRIVKKQFGQCRRAGDRHHGSDRRGRAPGARTR